MDYKDTYDKLKALQNRAFSLYKEDKKYIRELSKEFNIDFVYRKNCSSCYADQIIVLLIRVKKELLPEENINCDYVVINDKDVWIKGRRINNETITNELVEWLIKNYSNHSSYIKRK